MRLRKHAEPAATPVAEPEPLDLVDQAEQAGWTLRRSDRLFLERLAEVVEGRRRIILVGGRLGELLPDATLLDPGLPESELHLRLSVLGGADVLVLDTMPEVPRGPLVRLLPHVKVGGVLLVREAADVAGFLADTARAMLDDAAELSPTDQRLVDVVGSIEVFGAHAMLVSAKRSWLKLREAEANDYLARAGTGQVLRTLPPQRFEARSVVRQSEERISIASAYAVPELSLREYSQVVCHPGQVVTKGRVLLPDTFRHNQGAWVNNRNLVPVGYRFGRPRTRSIQPTKLPGSYFFLDSEYRGHFGHAMTEQLSRLWAWPEAKAADPSLKALMLNGSRNGLFGFERDLYGAAGIDLADLVVVDGPVRVERLVAATPMFSQPAYVHPDLADVWELVGDRLVKGAAGEPVPSRIFCSRRHGKRACNNAVEVEEYFASEGFHVVYTEDHSMADQARMFREADVVAGYAGSALFNLIFSTSPKRVLLLSSEGYVAQNEHLVAAVGGHDVTVAWCRPDRPRREGEGWSNEWFQSNFTFDFEREGRLVAETLASLV